MKSLLIDAENQKPTFSISSAWAYHRLSPSLNQLHLHFLVKFKGSLKDTQKLMTEWMNCNRTRALMNRIFMLFLNMLYIAIVDDMRSSQAEDLWRNYTLKIAHLSSLTSRLQSGERINELFFIWKSRKVKKKMLNSRLIFVSCLKSNSKVHLI